ncbi:hypothetical protein MTER_31250 [Mycolicibacter terrae]|jgi:hypothetical protein|uniref:DUF732 domain-containing protein n=1 Tax=Mycolicibacter terrae TaxID=1788 RepID=A0AAD1MJ74_9MYCO|nr:DUF732 domain-containing protein [Mycolicibacter terrae]ORW88627.1 ABC transporter substrate-binding protein [Mycolicibacter terrae]BBX23714.1 hypothetical protein MTER_31250 [Mycolicibacter terrae]SNV60666.1 Protein of uncharacterised function (DUF732) [Mycolicibacter terrae]
MSWILRTAALAGAASMALLGSAPAHADDASYIAALDANGVFRSGPPNARLSAGHRFCNQLRSGETPEQIIATFPRRPSFGGPSMVDDLTVNLRPVIDIAQHELCPETLT